MQIPVPSLTANGWLYEFVERADALMANYITSEHSQSYIYHGYVTSLTYHIQQHGEAPARLEEAVKRDLTAYFSRYFDGIELEVTTKLPDPDDPNRLNLMVDAVIIEEGQRYSLGREVQTLNNRVVNVFDLNNEGEIR